MLRRKPQPGRRNGAQGRLHGPREWSPAKLGRAFQPGSKWSFWRDRACRMHALETGTKRIRAVANNNSRFRNLPAADPAPPPPRALGRDATQAVCCWVAARWRRCTCRDARFGAPLTRKAPIMSQIVRPRAKHYHTSHAPFLRLTVYEAVAGSPTTTICSALLMPCMMALLAALMRPK